MGCKHNDIKREKGAAAQSHQRKNKFRESETTQTLAAHTERGKNG